MFEIIGMITVAYFVAGMYVLVRAWISNYDHIRDEFTTMKTREGTMIALLLLLIFVASWPLALLLSQRN
jgi:hypothetical protein